MIDLSWFNVDWGKRWGLPICALALAGGMAAGAAWYRYEVPAVTGTPFAPVVTSVATTTATPTVAPVQGPALVKTVTVTAAPVVETVEKQAEAAVERRTVTVTTPAPPKPAETRTETVTATKTATETERVLVADLKRGNGNDEGR